MMNMCIVMYSIAGCCYLQRKVVLGHLLHAWRGDQAGIFLGWILRVQHLGPKWCGGVGVPSGVGNL